MLIHISIYNTLLISNSYHSASFRILEHDTLDKYWFLAIFQKRLMLELGLLLIEKYIFSFKEMHFKMSFRELVATLSWLQCVDNLLSSLNECLGGSLHSHPKRVFSGFRLRPGAPFLKPNPSMNKQLHPLWSVGLNYLSFPKLQRCNRNFTPHITGHVITYPFLLKGLILVSYFFELDPSGADK